MTVQQLVDAIANNCPPNCPYPVKIVDPDTGKDIDLSDAKVLFTPTGSLELKLVAAK